MIRKLYTVLAITLMIILTACMAEEEQRNTGKQALNQNEEAEKIYRKNCRLCHGKEGQKMLGGASDLSISPLTLEERTVVITNGRGNMAAFNNKLSQEEIQALAIYLDIFIKR